MLFYRELEEMGNAGVVTAQIVLGMLLEMGSIHIRDPVTARRWYEKAAEAGNKFAQFALYRILYSEFDAREEAISWLRKAAESDFWPAALALGNHYLNSDQSEDSKVRGFQWIESAVKGGYLPAFSRLAKLYEKGVGTKRSSSNATRILREGAEKGDVVCAYDLGTELLRKQSLSKPQIDDALKWIREAVKSGYPPACVALARGYMQGSYGLSADREIAELIMELARSGRY